MEFRVIQEPLREYYDFAIEEYSKLEEDRHKHFTFNGVDGSHPEAIAFWLNELREYIGGRKSDEQLFSLGKTILSRTTTELNSFFESIEDQNDKKQFIQGLIKTEAKLLKLDSSRSDGYFSIDNSEALKPEIERKDELLEVEKSRAVLNSKKEINVKEFEERYGISKTTQQQYRSRYKDKLPSFQLSPPKGKIYYKVDLVEQWLKNLRK